MKSYIHFGKRTHGVLCRAKSCLTTGFTLPGFQTTQKTLCPALLIIMRMCHAVVASWVMTWACHNRTEIWFNFTMQHSRLKVEWESFWSKETCQRALSMTTEENKKSLLDKWRFGSQTRTYSSNERKRLLRSKLTRLHGWNIKIVMWSYGLRACKQYLSATNVRDHDASSISQPVTQPTSIVNPGRCKCKHISL